MFKNKQFLRTFKFFCANARLHACVFRKSLSVVLGLWVYVCMSDKNLVTTQKLLCMKLVSRDVP